MKKQLLLGLMAMSLPLTTWADGLTVKVLNGFGGKDATVEYNGTSTKNDLKIEVYAEGSTTALELNKDYQLYYAEDPRHVGTYTVEAVGIGTYLKKDGNTNFTVVAKTVSQELELPSSVSKVYGQDDQVLLTQLVPATAISDGVLAPGDDVTALHKCLTVARWGDSEGNTVGTYYVMVQAKEGEGLDYKYTVAEGGDYATLHITHKELTAEITEQATYNGSNLGLTYYATNNKYKITGVESGDEVSISDFEYDEKVKDAGTYNLTAVLDGKDKDNYTIDLVEFVIKPATLTITKTAGNDDKFSTVFDGNTKSGNLTDYFTYTEFKGNDATDVKGKILTMQWNADNANAGKTKVMPYVNGTLWDADKNPLPNYDIVYEKPAEFVISPKTIEGSWISVNDLTYQGKFFDVTNNLTVKYGEGDKAVELVYGEDYENILVMPETDANGKDANTRFKVAIDGKGNYAGKTIKSDFFTIEKATLTITALEEGEGVKWSKEYTAIEYQDVLTNQFDYDEFKGEDDAASIGLSMKKQYTNPSVGKYSVLVYNNGKLYDEETNAFTNYEIEYETVAKFEITPAKLKYSIKSDTVTYNGTAQKINFTTVEAEEGFGFKGDDSWEKVARTDKSKIVAPIIEVADGDTKNAGEHKLILTNKDEVSAGPNYEVEYVEADAKLTIDPSTVTITISNKTVGFEDFAEELSEEKLAGLVQDTEFTNIDNKPKSDNVGRKTLRDMIMLELQNGAETGASGVYENGIVATIKAVTKDDETMLKNYGYGLVDEEGNPTHFIIKNGTLTIGNVAEPLVLDGEENAEALREAGKEALPEALVRLNGATVDKVIMKNLQNIVSNNNILSKNRWYSLVLPFDVTVREISNIFGYAIVNVPNYDKGSASAVSFSLTMGTVPANTLMLFKVDEKQDWGENYEKEFTGKTIVAPGEPKSDNAGNMFVGVYENTPIAQANQMFLWYDGEFYDAATTPQTIYPLNGYVETATAGARIFVEEADGSTTAINAITGEAITNAAEGWYTIGGVKLSGEPTEKGIYINNGVKVVIK